MSTPETPVKLTVGRRSEVVGWVDASADSGQVIADVVALLRETATELEREHTRQATS